MIFSLNSAVGSPSYLPELIAMPSPAKHRCPASTSSRSAGGHRIAWIDDRLDRQAKLLGEFEVAFVVCRHGHDRAGAVADQHVVGDPDRHRLAVHRIDRVAAGEDAGLFLRQFGAIEIALAAAARSRLRPPTACSAVVKRSTNGCSGAITM